MSTPERPSPQNFTGESWRNIWIYRDGDQGFFAMFGTVRTETVSTVEAVKHQIEEMSDYYA